MNNEEIWQLRIETESSVGFLGVMNIPWVSGRVFAKTAAKMLNNDGVRKDFCGHRAGALILIASLAQCFLIYQSTSYFIF